MTLYDSELSYDSIVSYSGGEVRTAHSWVEIAAIAFTGAPDDDGVEWWISDLKGWDSADVRAGSTARPGDDGLFLPTFRHGGRLIELEGAAVAPTAEAAFDAKNRLLGELDVRSFLNLFVHEDRPRVVEVVRNGSLKLEQRSRLLRFSIPLLARDPRKYAADEVDLEGAAAEELVFTNEGTVATLPTVTITGPITEPTIVNVTTGQQVAFDVALAAGDVLVVDFDLRSVVSDGVSFRSTLMSGYRWWSLPPGATTMRLDGTGTDVDTGLVVSARSAWI